jgi:hypothetical protein
MTSLRAYLALHCGMTHDAGSIAEEEDASIPFYVRTEVLCATCRGREALWPGLCVDDLGASFEVLPACLPAETGICSYGSASILQTAHRRLVLTQFGRHTGT